MISYRAPNNDVYIFIEPKEIPQLSESRQLIGKFIDSNRKKIGLTLKIDDVVCRIHSEMVVQDRADPEHLIITTMSRVLNTFQTCGSAEPHLGYAHLCLRNTSKLNQSDLFNYLQLKS